MNTPSASPKPQGYINLGEKNGKQRDSSASVINAEVTEIAPWCDDLKLPYWKHFAEKTTAASPITANASPRPPSERGGTSTSPCPAVHLTLADKHIKSLLEQLHQKALHREQGWGSLTKH